MAADSAQLFLPEPLAETLSQYVVAGFSPRSINFYPDLYFFCRTYPFAIYGADKLSRRIAVFGTNANETLFHRNLT